MRGYGLTSLPNRRAPSCGYLMFYTIATAKVMVPLCEPLITYPIDALLLPTEWVSVPCCLVVGVEVFSFLHMLTLFLKTKISPHSYGHKTPGALFAPPWG